MKRKKYAILGDVHSNWEALTSVLAHAETQNVDAYLCVGDIVGYNSNPSECLDKLREIGCRTVRGNHDHYCSSDASLGDFHPLAASVVDWTRHQLAPEQAEYLRSLPYHMVVDGFTMVHGTLDMPEKWGYVFDVLDADANFNYQHTSVCFHGHTHVPVIYEKQDGIVRNEESRVRCVLGRKYFVNTGSVGQPRDRDTRASYVTYDLSGGEIMIRRVAYDFSVTQQKIQDAGLPDRLAKRLAAGK